MNYDELYAYLERVRDFLDNYADVSDRDIPNEAMKLRIMCEVYLTQLEKL